MSSGGKKISNRANCVDQMLNLELGFEAAIHHSPEWFSADELAPIDDGVKWPQRYRL